MFNELSVSQVSSIAEVHIVLENFVRAAVGAKEMGLSEIRLHESLQNLYQLSLNKDYRIDNWLNDKAVNSDLQDKFRDIVTTSPLITNNEIQEAEFYQRSEFYKTLDQKESIVFGLGAAHIFGSLAISLYTHPEWAKSSIEVFHYSLDHEGQEKKADIMVPHFSSPESLELHRKWLENEQKATLDRSIELWDKRHDLFPNIEFGLELKTGFQSIGMTKKLNQVFDTLKKLDNYTKNWTRDGFELIDLINKTGLDVSGESESTMKMYSALRKFKLPSGEKALFELHIKLGSTRIYFLPNTEVKKIIVGYVGKHLRTVKFN